MNSSRNVKYSKDLATGGVRTPINTHPGPELAVSAWPGLTTTDPLSVSPVAEAPQILKH